MNTKEFYNSNAKNYFEKTINAPNIFNLEKFYDLFQKDSLLCDLGCGSGRDSLYFKEHGLNVLPIDYSEGLINCSKELKGLNILQKDFRTINYNELFDGIWANASLLHLTCEEFKNIIPKIYKSLKPYGFLYISLKPVKDNSKLFEEELVGNRFFTRYSLEELEHIFNSFDIKIKEFWMTKSTIGENQDWINILIQKI